MNQPASGGFLVPLLLSSLCLGCSADQLTELIVVVDTDLQVPREVEAVRLVLNASEVGQPMQEATIPLSSRPVTLGLVHRGGALGPVLVTATGLLASQEILARSARVWFVKEQIRVLRLDLLAACRGVSCAQGQTCRDDGVCHPVDVPESELGGWSGTAQPLAPVSDAGPDGDPDFDGGETDADGAGPVDADATVDGEACVPVEEECNGEDDNCNALIDEGFGLDSDPFNCGFCNRNCPAGEACIARACASDHVAVAAGGAHSCALTAEGEVECWGDNSQGQVNGSPGAELGVTTVQGLATPVVSLSAGGEHSCAVVATGEVWCWGSDAEGQLGDSDARTGPGPVRAGVLAEATSVSAGTDHTCATTRSKVLWCWGKNVDGRLGDNSTDGRDAPVQVHGDHDFVAVSAGGEHTCAIDVDGHLWCWGRNDLGQVGVAGGGNRTSPVQARESDDPLEASMVVTGDLHSCAVILPDRTVRCFGQPQRGQLGHGTTTGAGVQTVQDLADDAPLTDVAWLCGGGSHNCAILADGRGVCWGDDEFGQLGVGGTPQNRSTIPKVTAGNQVFHRLACGTAHTCGRDEGGTLWCWGQNLHGALGEGEQVDQSEPVPVTP
jgi:alpha-tubulin suppressor-like RCC1 family protein